MAVRRSSRWSGWDFPCGRCRRCILPWHPGHGKATRIETGGGDFAALVGDLRTAPRLGEIGGGLTGYFGDADQVEAVASLIQATTAENSALYLCDPVIGDKGGLFRPEPLAVAIRDRLLPLADIATPNRHELEWLAGKSLADNDALVAAAMNLGPKEVVVTSAFASARRNRNTPRYAGRRRPRYSSSVAGRATWNRRPFRRPLPRPPPRRQ